MTFQPRPYAERTVSYSDEDGDRVTLITDATPRHDTIAMIQNNTLNGTLLSRDIAAQMAAVLSNAVADYDDVLEAEKAKEALTAFTPGTLVLVGDAPSYRAQGERLGYVAPEFENAVAVVQPTTGKAAEWFPSAVSVKLVVAVGTFTRSNYIHSDFLTIIGRTLDADA